MSANNRYLTAKKIYELYGIEPKQTYYWIREKRIVYVKPGTKTILIPEKDFLRFLALNTIEKEQ